MILRQASIAASRAASDEKIYKFQRADAQVWDAARVPKMERRPFLNLTGIVIRFAVFCQECPFWEQGQSLEEYLGGCLD